MYNFEVTHERGREKRTYVTYSRSLFDSLFEAAARLGGKLASTVYQSYDLTPRQTSAYFSKGGLLSSRHLTSHSMTRLTAHLSLGHYSSVVWPNSMWSMNHYRLHLYGKRTVDLRRVIQSRERDDSPSCKWEWEKPSGWEPINPYFFLEEWLAESPRNALLLASVEGDEVAELALQDYDQEHA